MILFLLQMMACGPSQPEPLYLTKEFYGHLIQNSLLETKEYYHNPESSRDLLGYNLYRDGALIMTLNSGETSYRCNSKTKEN